MALLWMDGFDTYGTTESDMLLGLYASLPSSSLFWQLDATQVRTGSYAMKWGGSPSSGVTTMRRAFGAEKTRVGVGFATYRVGLPEDSDQCLLFDFSDHNNDRQLRVSLGADGRLNVYSMDVTAGTLIGASDPGAISGGAWNHIEAAVTCHASTGSVEIRVNGVTVVDLSGVDTDPQATGDLSFWGAGKWGSASGGNREYYLDDLFAWDDTGDANNDFIGDVKVYTLLPDADTAQADWTLSAGSDGYALIDEVPQDGDTTYLETSGNGDESDFDFPSLPAEVSAVIGLQAVSVARKTDAGAANLVQSLISSEVGSPPAAATQDGATHALTTSYSYYADTFDVDPATGAAWTPTAVNGVSLGLTRTE